MNKKKKSTNTSPYPDEAIERLARAFYPAILAYWNSEEGQREFAAWQAEQAHHANNEKQEVLDGELPAFTYRVWIFAGCVQQGAPRFSYKLIAIHLFLLMLRFFRVFFINQREKVLSINTWTIQSIQ